MFPTRLRISCSLVFAALFCAISLQSLGQRPLDRIVNANYRDQTIEQILTDLEKQDSAKFFFKTVWLGSGTYSPVFRNIPLRKALDTLLQPLGLGYLEYDRFSIIIAKEAALKERYGQAYWENRRALREAVVAQGQAVGSKDAASKTGKAKITGRVTDAQDGSAIVGAIVRSDAAGVNTTTDAAGDYELELPVGLRKLQIDATGYDTRTLTLRVFNDGRADAPLFKGSVLLQEITVRDALNRKIRSTQIGLLELSGKQIKEATSLMGEADVIKSLLTLPGVSAVGEASAGYNVRGGATDQNLILQDGMLLLNSSHALGFFSTFNADVVKKVDLYKGQIPAQFGGRLSSVLDVQLKEGDKEKWVYNGGVGPFSGRLTVEGPIVKDQTSILFGVRATYSDWILKQVNDYNVSHSQMSFSDWNAKITHSFSPAAALSVSAYQSADHFQYSTSYGFNWKTQLYGLEYRQNLGTGYNNLLSASYGDMRNETYSPDSLFNYNLKNGLQHVRIKDRVLATVFKGHTLTGGFEWSLYEARPETYSRTATLAQSAATGSIAKDKGSEFSLFINDEIELGKNWSVALGLRRTLYRQLGAANINQYAPGQLRDFSNITGVVSYTDGQTAQSYSGLEPRFALNYVVAPDASIKLSYNRLFQYIHLISNTASSTPVDVWQVSTPYIQPERSDNFSLGYFKNVSDEWEASAETYFKWLDHTVEYKDFASLLRNDHLETELLSGVGKAYGAEFFVKKNKGALTGSLSYTYARTLRRTTGVFAEETINKGNWYPAAYDKPHTVNAEIHWRVRKTQTLAVFFTYSTGRPITAATSDYLIGVDGLYPDFSARNNYRIADYHRMDVSYTVARGEIRTKRYHSSLTFSIYNIYGRKNPFSVYFKQTRDQPLQAYALSLLGTPLPSVTYNFHF